MGSFGLLTLVPVTIVILLAIFTKKFNESLFFGFIATYIIISICNGDNFLSLIEESFFTSISNRDNLWIIAVVLLFGCFVELLKASGGTTAISEVICKKCKGEKSVGIFTWLLSIIIFIDGYLNVMTVGSCMKNTYDKKKMPREALAYTINSTSVCACVLIPFSTWSVFFSSIFYQQDAIKNLGYGSAIKTYYHIIPYIFYAFFSLALVLLFSIKVLPAFGPMKESYDNYIEKVESQMYETKKGHLIDFLIPIGILVASVLLLSNMLVSLIITIICCFILYVPRKIISAKDFSKVWIHGMQEMFPSIIVLTFAFLMKQACVDINLPSYVAEKTLPFVTAELLPVIAFIFLSILSYMTGNGWSVSALCIPIIIPMAESCGANLILTMAAIVSGGVFCEHACFYSDFILLTSASCEIDSINHAKTQLPYSTIAFACSLFVYIILGFIIK